MKNSKLVVTGIATLFASWPALGQSPFAGADTTSPIKVEVVHDGGRYLLLRGGEPYRVKGAGAGIDGLAALAAHGGNSFRTWGTDAEMLEAATRHGVTVSLCLCIGRERDGFDYDDEDAVAAQLAWAEEEVRKYKDNPALLAWIIGNEPNLEFENPKVFDAIDAISRMIHEVDGNHPTTTALAGFSGELAALVEERAPDLDFISLQLYGDAVHLPRHLEETGFDEPLLITEWGTVGYWEAPRTSWGAPIELSSSDKARAFLAAYDAAVASNPDQVIGSYAFLWGQKQERTPTWFGMFLADGTETEAVDVMHYLWNGEWPDNRAPQVDQLLLDARSASGNIVLAPGETYEASIAAADPDGDALDFRWEIMPESTATQTGGDAETVPEALPGLIQGSDRQINVTAPENPGPYRLFVYVYDAQSNAGHANIPFLVQ